MKINEYDEKSYYEKEILDENDITPFNTTMQSKIFFRAKEDKLEDTNSEEYKEMQKIKMGIFQDILKNVMSQRKKISVSEMTSKPEQYGTIKNGKFVSFLDQFYEQEGIETDRDSTNSLKKKQQLMQEEKQELPKISDMMMSNNLGGVE